MGHERKGRVSSAEANGRPIPEVAWHAIHPLGVPLEVKVEPTIAVVPEDIALAQVCAHAGLREAH
jgi:hypothetical protein